MTLYEAIKDAGKNLHRCNNLIDLCRYQLNMDYKQTSNAWINATGCTSADFDELTYECESIKI